MCNENGSGILCCKCCCCCYCEGENRRRCCSGELHFQISIIQFREWNDHLNLDFMKPQTAGSFSHYHLPSLSNTSVSPSRRGNWQRIVSSLPSRRPFHWRGITVSSYFYWTDLSFIVAMFFSIFCLWKINVVSSADHYISLWQEVADALNNFLFTKKFVSCFIGSFYHSMSCNPIDNFSFLSLSVSTFVCLRMSVVVMNSLTVR